INVNPTHQTQAVLLGKSKYDYILGNPPFIGKSLQNAEQKADMDIIFSGVKGAGVLDYVAAWYVKAAQIVQNTNTKVAFVSTNSIAQGEQVGILWNLLFSHYKIKIHFAHRTFSWRNEAKGNAAVHCVIIGFANYDTNSKNIFEYEDIKGEPHEIKAKNINPYLVEGKDFALPSRAKPLCNVPEMSYGSMANDGGNLLMNDEEKNRLIKQEPKSAKVIKQFIGSYEFINNIKRWCIWLKDVAPHDFANLKEVTNRINEVKKYRLKSTRKATQKLSDFPSLFGEIRQPNSNYLLIPGVSSENRKYIPIGYLSSDIIASDLARTIPNASLFMFGVMTSTLHMTWAKYTCGRLKSDFRYSSSLVYNNYPWPENPTEKQIKSIETSAQKVLDTRAEFPNSSLADLYDPLTMPPALVKAHDELDKAVDLAYRSQPFTSEAKRMEFLFELYEKYTADLFTKEKPHKTKKKV
ncbi:MAG TPA: class I SAM-dependent DNA methyltransferase, partial [Bacteroidia bacterium]|nr:class I SAM-dependent DNA methyltransferase [Bacteroidia bacterium]